MESSHQSRILRSSESSDPLNRWSVLVDVLKNGGVEIVDVSHARQGQGHHEVNTDRLDNVNDPLLSASCHGVHPWPTNQTRSRAEGQRLYDVKAAAHPAVHEDLDTLAHGVGNRGERSRG